MHHQSPQSSSVATYFSRTDDSHYLDIATQSMAYLWASLLGLRRYRLAARRILKRHSSVLGKCIVTACKSTHFSRNLSEAGRITVDHLATITVWMSLWWAPRERSHSS
ncbi:hypothetical protein AC578_8514 [Pseudocercospora eumusae]|uniref:Uncharacterized protein n=1 Tax=Pseudocercospora eumusae TaxID=321146 RepID=A0A139HWF9_9PEZI|nr:hypothetical protein AC578_8514 [Pseudocercospora eumusae]KXT06730.1 hypothetical protein AC578_8514 [Pseudocercospora eumusae]